jgi:hypothetical protein
MITSLYFASSQFEPIYGWLEAQAGLQVEVWGLETGRRMALLAYSDGPDDDFGWADWARSASEDPSELSGMFETLELVAESAVADQLKAAFAGVLATSPS